MLAIAQYVGDAFDMFALAHMHVCMPFGLVSTRYGSGLVSEFEVDDSFKSCKKRSYLNDQISPLGKPEKHSMLLIGFRPGLRPSNFYFIFILFCFCFLFFDVTILYRSDIRLRLPAPELVAGHGILGGVCAVLGSIECALTL